MTERKWHQVIAGDVDAAREHGLTVKAKCGKVWVPTLVDASESDDLEHCSVCYQPIPGYVYRCYDASGLPVYIGCTIAPKTRLATHASNSWWWPMVDRTRVTVFADKYVALSKEQMAIYLEAPLCNTRGVPLESMSADELQQRLDRLAGRNAPSKLLARIAKAGRQVHGVELEVAS